MRISCARSLATVAAFLIMLPAYGQIPSLLTTKVLPQSSAGTAVQADAAPADTSEKEMSDAQGRIHDAKDTLTRLQRQLAVAGLPDVKRNEILKRYNLTQTLADRYAQQIDYIKQIQILDQKIIDARRQRDDWVPPTGSPPWSIVEGDQVRNEMLVEEARISQLNKELVSASNQIITLAQEKSDSETKLRQIEEKFGKTGQAGLNEDERKTLEEAQDLLALRSAVLLRSDLDRKLKERDKKLQELRLEIATRTWNYFANRFVLTPEVLANAKTELQTIIDRDRDLEIKALVKSELAMKRLDQAQLAFRNIEQTSASRTQLDNVRATLDIAQAEETAARSEVDRLRKLIEMGGYGLQLWDARAEIYATPRPNAARLEAIASRVRLALVRIRQTRDFEQQNLTAREQEAFDLREADLASQTPLERRVLAAKLQSANAESDANRSVLAALDKFEQYLELLQSELGIKDQDKSFYERVVGYGQRLIAFAHQVWVYELFTVDDTIVADGKEVKTTRSVTVGKSVGAIAILLFGFFMLSWLIRNAMGLAEKRMGLKSSSATIIKRWLMVISTATLIILSFNLVQIPLSVFAFLGGALAIGVGFGTQNLLKNLISGAMLLIERPIRIGDLVEIDGVKGRVTSIGIRFSSIHSADGVDTLIPNSELVEKKLVNWTYSNPDARREIRIGVAYGASVVEVKNLLRAAALEHPDVVRTPEPNVMLDDFAESALVFTLRYWIRLDVGLDGKQIDSDLRCEILEKLTAAGIDVPYPQRDVHLRVKTPIQVQMQSEG